MGKLLQTKCHVSKFLMKTDEKEEENDENEEEKNVLAILLNGLRDGDVKVWK